MSTLCGFGPRWRLRLLAIEVEPVLFSVRDPSLFEHLDLLSRRDAEAAERQDHGSDSDVGLGGFANMPAVRARNNARRDVPLSPNPVQHGVLAAQEQQCQPRYLMPKASSAPSRPG